VASRHAAPWPDDAVADEMERPADRARTWEGAAAAVAVLERAAELDADAPDTAYKLPATAEMGQLDDLQRARLTGQARAAGHWRDRPRTRRRGR
jgi:hypothetical protein